MRAPAPRRLRGVLGLLALAWVLPALAVVGCSENQKGKFEEFVQNPSSQPKFLSPASGATGVSPLPEIHVGYEDSLDYAKATTDVIQLFDMGPTLTTPTRVAVSIVAAADGRGFDVVPLNQLVAPRTFEVRVLGRTTGLRFQKGSDVDDMSFRFTTAPDPAFTTPAGAIDPGQHGASYGPYQLSTTGGAPPLSFAIAEGTLPGGLSIDLAVGRISGVPTITAAVAQNYEFTVTVTDGVGRTGSRTFSILVNP